MAPKGIKRKADAKPAAPYNPLRDRALLENASVTLAKTIYIQKRQMTAMAFCREVLTSLGLTDIAIGQAERITISGFRKATLGPLDPDVIIKPDAAAPVIVPHLRTVMGTAGVEPTLRGTWV